MAEEKQYNVKLRQEVVVTAEQFTIEATSKKQAIEKAQNFVNEHKDYKEGTYTLEAEEIEQPEPELTPEEQE